jgi:hypothetical protein
MTEPVQKIYNSIQEALMDYARLGVDAARRPKPPSLKEQALAVLDDAKLDSAHYNIILRALEALPGD